MTNIFSFIDDILYHKRGDLIRTAEDESEFSPYMINRWLSMHSPEMAEMINLIGNKINIQSKQQYYKHLVAVIPKQKRQRIKYIRKMKAAEKTDEPDELLVARLAKKLQISQREVSTYIKQL